MGKNDQLAIFISDISRMKACPARYEKRLPQWRARRMKLYRSPEDRLRCLVGWLLIERFFGNCAELDDVFADHAFNGKPRLPDGPEFSLSHSGDLVSLALGAMPVGVDVEQWRDEEHISMARAAFHAEEFAALDLTGDIARQFYELWALKESYLKMRGIGLGVNPASFCLRESGEGISLAGEENLFFKLYRDIPGYSIAVCSGQGGWPDRPVFVDF